MTIIITVFFNPVRTMWWGKVGGLVWCAECTSLHRVIFLEAGEKNRTSCESASPAGLNRYICSVSKRVFRPYTLPIIVCLLH